MQNEHSGGGADDPAQVRLGIGSRIVMMTGGVSVALALSALTPVLPLIESELAKGPGDALLVKLLVVVIGFTMVLGAPIAGHLVDRIGSRPVLVGAGILYAAGGTAGLYLDSLHLLIVSRLFVGLAASSIAATSMTLINSALDGPGRAKWMGAHVAIATIGGLFIFPAAGFLGEISWRGPFALYALGLVFPILAMLDEGVRLSPAKPTGNSAPRGERLLDWFPVRFAVIALVLGTITYLPTVYLPFVLRDAGVSRPMLISLVGLGDAVLTAIMALQFARARRRLSSEAAFVFSFSCTAFGLSVVTVWPSVIGIIAGMGIFGLGLGWFVPNLMTAAAAEALPDRQGRTVGAVKAAHYLAAPLSVIAVDPIARMFGPVGALSAAAILSAGLLLYNLLRLRGRVWAGDVALDAG